MESQLAINCPIRMNKTMIITLCSLFFLASACKSQKESAETTAETASEATTETVKKGRGERPNPADRAARLEEMMTSLNLSADQQVQFKAIDAKYGEKMRALREGGDREAMRAGMKSLQDQKMAELTNVLSAEQLTKYKEMLAARRPNKGGRR